MAPPLTLVANHLNDFPDDSLITAHAPHRRHKGLASRRKTTPARLPEVQLERTNSRQRISSHTCSRIWKASPSRHTVSPEITLGLMVTAQIYEIAGGTNSYRSSNSIVMYPSLHSSLFDLVIFWLVPHISDTFDIPSSTFYEVELVWRGRKVGMALLVSQLPEDPGRQLDRHGFHRLLDAARHIRSGNRFRLQTHDSASSP